MQLFSGCGEQGIEKIKGQCRSSDRKEATVQYELSLCMLYVCTGGGFSNRMERGKLLQTQAVESKKLCQHSRLQPIIGVFPLTTDFYFFLL